MSKVILAKPGDFHLPFGDAFRGSLEIWNVWKMLALRQGAGYAASEKGSLMKLIRKLSKLILAVAGFLVFAVGVIYFVRAFDARSLRNLEPEHRIELEAEFRAGAEAETDWQAYLSIEDALYAELEKNIHDQDRSGSAVDRYSSSSQMFPASHDRNWNRSYVLRADEPRGVAVLLHGLTDSPYSMRATAQLLVRNGFNVVVPRMPGHGFAVGGLKHVRWEDWTAAVRVAVRHAETLPGADQKLVMAGYSNGGLLALDYSLRCGREVEVACPDRVVLMSPAIAVTPASIVANWHSAVSWHPYFEKFAWLHVLPEIDPFKYTSFPKQPGWEIYSLAHRVYAMLEDKERTDNLPPFLTFQSAVDNTVSAVAVVEMLYSRLPSGASKLVVYDINRSNTASHLMDLPHHNPQDFFLERAPLDYEVTVLANRDNDSDVVDAFSLLPGASQYDVEETSLAWPLGNFSLSHIAVPFMPDDPLYGHAIPGDTERVMLGALQPRGEAGVLSLTSDYFLRARSNPFFDYQAATIEQWLAVD